MSYFPNYPQQQFYPQPPMGQLEQLRQQQYQQYTPQMQQPQMAQQQNNIVWVRSEMEARNYLVAPNCSVTMWNENGMEIYLKKADSSGRPEFEVYDVVKRVESPQPPQRPANPNDEIVTVGKLKAVLANLGLLPVKNKEVKEDTANE